MRRIIEKIIYNAREIAESKGTISLDKFDSVDFDGKIKILENLLPKALIEKKQLYKVLSIGIHKLDNSICFEIFPIVFKNTLDIFKELGNQKNYENILEDTKNELKKIEDSLVRRD